MRTIVLASFLAAVAAYVLGFLFWGVSPVSPFLSAPDAEAARQAVAAFPEAGAYMVPDANSEDWEAMLAEAREGYALVFARPDGVEMAAPSVMGAGFVVMWGAAFLLALLLSTAVREGRGYGWRVAFCVCVGGATTIWATLGLAIWWHLPWAFPGLNVVYDLAAFTLMGLVLARFIRPPAPAADASWRPE